MKLEFWVNGQYYQLDIAPDEMLSDVLRYRLGLTGTKIGCEEAECGACTVLLENEVVLSCNFPAARAAGKSVLTIESLASSGELHPLQQAFIEHGAVQCGFCTPGQIMSAYALLEANLDPTEYEIRKALKANLCRCGTYPAILAAIQAVASGVSQPAVGIGKATESEAERLIGKPAPRPDALDKVIGAAKYADDYRFPGMLHGRVLRAGVPHGTLLRLDVSKAKVLDGVQSVLTAEDVSGDRLCGHVIRDWPILVGISEKVRYVGDALAIVAAETRQIASQALSLIEFEIEPLPPLTETDRALDSQAPKLHEQGNLLVRYELKKGDTEEGMARANHRINGEYETPAYDHLFIEPECSIARPLNNGKMEIYVGSQSPFDDRRQIAQALGMVEEQIRVIGTVVGGAFGGKEDIAGQIHAALLAQATDRPVKVLWDRHESLLVHPKRHATKIRYELGISEDGRFLAARARCLADTGAYASLGRGVMTRMSIHSVGAYAIDNVHTECQAIYTNNPPAGACRGFGVFQPIFAMETLVEEAAEVLGLDPIEIRRRNALKVGSATSTGQVLRESVGLLLCINAVDEAMRQRAQRRDPFKSARVDNSPELRRAWGFAIGHKNVGMGIGRDDRAEAEVRLAEDGFFEVLSGAAEIGQGVVSVLQLIAAEELGVHAEHVRVYLSDTDQTPDAGATTASRQTYVSGNAVKGAARQLRGRLVDILAELDRCMPESVTLGADGAITGGRRISYIQVHQKVVSAGFKPCIRYMYHSPVTETLGSSGDVQVAYGFAAQAAEVEINLSTGEVHVLTVITAVDVGKVINPLGVRSQIEGGIMMGIGHALTEEFIIDKGQVFSDHMARYRIPNMTQMPEIVPIVIEAPISSGPYGAKGIGELVSLPTAPAITNGVYHACGVRVRRLPIDPDLLARQLSQINS